MSEIKKKELIFIPSPGMCHLIPAVEMAKLLIAREEHLSITVLIMRMNLDSNLNPYIQSLSSNNANCSSSRFKFIDLPRDESTLQLLNSNTFFSGFIDSHKPQSLRDDFDIYVTNYKDDPESELSVPSYFNPFPAKCFLLVFLDKEGLGNSCYEIALFGRENPTVYPVRPLLNLNNSLGDKEIIKWLDAQTPYSVVFLCFGTSGSFNEEQVKEIANALENSGCRFLWSLRKPPPKDSWYPSDYENTEDVLPEGFLQRTKRIGMVIGWAPQGVILSHSAVGGFVSHCGWNSVLESVWFGVPMATWPMYSEQQANAFQLVKDLGTTVDIKMDYKITGSNIDIIKAEKIQKAIGKLMEPENGIRMKVKDMKEKSRLALQEGGSSYTSVGHFIEQVMSNHYSSVQLLSDCVQQQ
ncbi:hypothetical protein K7X08_005929 [Anisodus acutangulus]|uniref:Glycosyltransferase n=1 Tax=Anisodus acutangulus TaxID=402998 RepID=A0A9Q1LS80_9SOLA|nr:hypothetical protein K7X08_005929 [Anisodus acutangulus]